MNHEYEYTISIHHQRLSPLSHIACVVFAQFCSKIEGPHFCLKVLVSSLTSCHSKIMIFLFSSFFPKFEVLTFKSMLMIFLFSTYVLNHNPPGLSMQQNFTSSLAKPTSLIGIKNTPNIFIYMVLF